MIYCPATKKYNCSERGMCTGCQIWLNKFNTERSPDNGTLRRDKDAVQTKPRRV